MRRFLAILGAVLALAQPAFAAGMATPVMVAPPTTGPNANATRYLQLAGGQQNSLGYATSPGDRRTPVPFDGTFSKLRIRCPGMLAGSYTVTLQKNGGDVGTPISAVCNSGSIVAVDDTNTLAVTAGDDVTLKVVGSGATAMSVLQMSLLFTSDADNRSVMFASHTTATTENLFMAPWGASGASTAASTATFTMPTAGTLTALYGRLNATPGGATSVAYTVHKNGSGTACAITFASADQTKSKADCSVGYVAGDTVTIERVASGGAPTGSVGTFGLGFAPTINGESVQGVTFAAALSTTGNRYGNGSGRAGNNGTESDAYVIAPTAFSARSMQVAVTTAPTSGKQWDFTLNVNGVASALTAQIDGIATAASDADGPNIADQDLLSLHVVGVSGPASTTGHRAGWVAYIAPPAAAGGGSTMNLLGVGR